MNAAKERVSYCFMSLKYISIKAHGLYIYKILHLSGLQSISFDRKLIDKLLKNYDIDVRPVENQSQVLEVALGLQPYRLLRVVGRIAFVILFFFYFWFRNLK